MQAFFQPWTSCSTTVQAATAATAHRMPGRAVNRGTLAGSAPWLLEEPESAYNASCPMLPPEMLSGEPISCRRCFLVF